MPQIPLKIAPSLKPARILAVATFLALATFSAPCPALGEVPQIPSIGDELGLSPFWDWKTLESEHFRISFDAPLEPIAQKTANYLEEAHRLLAPTLKWEPSTKIQVLLLDNTDQANGLATAVQRFGMVLFATPPENWSSIAYYDDWLRLLALHEYTHILNVDTTRGAWKWLRYLFGDLFFPNALWPSWMTEGLAVYMETRFTQGGRGRSPFYEMILRQAVAEGALASEEFITLDRVNGTNPYFPGGETPYLFGYQLMNQMARSGGGDSTLGSLSNHSSRSFPYFVNSNAREASGKTWYSLWEKFLTETRDRMQADIDRIKSQPLTPITRLTQGEYGALGATPSPDGRWLAYNRESLHRRRGLNLMDLQTGRSRRIDHKIGGMKMAFTPDSRFLIYSSLDQQDQYYLFNGLKVYDLEEDETYDLSENLRASDPAVSPDGKAVIFALNENASTGLALAYLIKNDDRLELGPMIRLYEPKPYDRASTPVFSPDGESVIFSLKANGETGEALMELELKTLKARPLVKDRNFNRFPAFGSDGNLYFVSNRTGVDNLYRYTERKRSGGTEQVTNVIGGLWLPAFGPDTVYASTFSTTGWDLAKIELSKRPIPSRNVSVVDPPAPGPHQVSFENKHYLVEDYSIFPSIWPRQWLPLPILGLGKPGFLIGGQILGFDATDRHRYALLGAYDTELEKAEALALYSNRSFGPNLTLSGSYITDSATYSKTRVLEYVKQLEFNADLSFPFRGTFWTLTPSIGANAEREFLYDPDISNSKPVDRSSYVPSADVRLAFSRTESSRLALFRERGVRFSLGTRAYLTGSGASEDLSYKGLATFTSYVPLTQHSVLVPHLRASTITRPDPGLRPVNVRVRGRINRLLESLPNDDLDELALRGYPGMNFFVKSAAVGSLDYRFPIAKIFRGWGTNPVSLNQLYGFVFAEAAHLPGVFGDASLTLPSAGAGLRLSTEILIRIPLVLSLEYHHGFREEFGGGGELFFGVNLANFSF